MNLGNAKIVFWDFDGVIKDSVSVKARAFHALFLPYGREVAEKVLEHHLANCGMSRYEKLPLYLNWAGLGASDRVIQDFAAKFSDAVEDAVVQSAWVPGVQTVLATGSETSKFVLITATPQAEIERILERLAIRRFFAQIVGAPIRKAAGISAALADFGVQPECALVIGDSREDLAAAQQCGVPFLLRRTPENARTMPDYNGPQIAGFG
ncbi:MAG: HAD family hydrolase [Steroidobacteraceae bacterium]